MSNEPVRLRLSPWKAALLRAALGEPRQLTRTQRLRNWARAIFGLPPRAGDEPYELPSFCKPKPLPQNTTGTVTFRRTLPTTGDRDGLR